MSMWREMGEGNEKRGEKGQEDREGVRRPEQERERGGGNQPLLS